VPDTTHELMTREQPALMEQVAPNLTIVRYDAALEEAAPPSKKSDKKEEKEGRPGELPMPQELDEKPATTASGLTLDRAINTTLPPAPSPRAGRAPINQPTAALLPPSPNPNPTFHADVQLLPRPGPFPVDRQGGPPQTDYQINYPIDWFLFGKRA